MKRIVIIRSIFIGWMFMHYIQYISLQEGSKEWGALFSCLAAFSGIYLLAEAYQKSFVRLVRENLLLPVAVLGGITIFSFGLEWAMKGFSDFDAELFFENCFNFLVLASYLVIVLAIIIFDLVDWFGSPIGKTDLHWNVEVFIAFEIGIQLCLWGVVGVENMRFNIFVIGIIMAVMIVTNLIPVRGKN